jgi:hypothetical protein
MQALAALVSFFDENRWRLAAEAIPFVVFANLLRLAISFDRSFKSALDASSVSGFMSACIFVVAIILNGVR